MKNEERIALLYHKYLQDKLQAEELLEWMEIVQDPRYDLLIQSLMEESFRQVEPGAEATAWQPAFERFKLQTKLKEPKPAPLARSVSWFDGLMPYWKAVAAVLVVGMLSYAYMHWQQRDADSLKRQEQAYVVREDVEPGGNRAILRMGDAAAIQLDEQGELIVNNEGLEDGLGNKLSLAPDASDLWRTIEVPKKGQYKLQLADGTLVWLNAASSLRFPIKFTAENRTVYLEGEAYFEVRENKKQPFVVKSSAHEVQVLGTSFNLSAYPNESTVTSLMSGMVDVRAAAKHIRLSPGMQSKAYAGSLSRAEVDVAAVSAWKDNRFVFVKEPLTSILRKLERWYDVEFIIQPGAERLIRKTYSGSLTRFAKLSETMELFTITESLDYYIKGNKVYLK